MVFTHKPFGHTFTDRAGASRIQPQPPIDSQTTTSQSLMPMGILNTFNRNQILDLMAYMESGGDPKHGLFKR